MIGNDIIDLRLANVQSNWRRKGFLEKICTTYEQDMIHRSMRPEVLVWRIWSMKESAYKARLRAEKMIRLSPCKFECRVIDKAKGQVYCDGNLYHTVSQIHDEFINTYALADHFDKDLHLDMLTIPPSESTSKTLYAAIISFHALKKDWNEKDMEIRKNELGIPELYGQDGKSSVLFSISHHGRYGSFVTEKQ